MRSPTLDVYYSVMGIIASTLVSAVYVPLGSWVGTTLGFMPTWHTMSVGWQCVCATVLMDFLAYWIHRLQHRSEDSFLWRAHSVHHAVPMLDVVAGAQVHFLDGFISASPLLVLAALGFSPVVCGLAYAMNLTTAGLHHTKLPIVLGWFNFVTIGPQTHRWHHADATAKTVNLGFVLALWDMLFGTFYYDRERQPEWYGARSVETFPDSLGGHLLVGTTASAYQRLVKLVKIDSSQRTELHDERVPSQSLSV